MSRFFALKQGFQFYRYPVRGQCQGFFSPVMLRSPPPGRGKRVPIHILSAIPFRSFRVLFHWITLLPQSLRLDETSELLLHSNWFRFRRISCDLATHAVPGGAWMLPWECYLLFRLFYAILVAYTLYIPYTSILYDSAISYWTRQLQYFNVLHVHFHSTHPWLSGISVCLYVSQEWENRKEI